MNKVAILREKVTRLVSMLTEKKVKVTQRGAKASVSYNRVTGAPESVNLPYIPEDADDVFCSAVEGFLDHEVAKVLYSDFNQIKKVKGSNLEGVFNLIEDAFVERKMQDTFRGSGQNLESVGSFYLNKVTTPNLRNEPDKAQKHLLAPAIRALSGQTLYKEFMEDKWGFVEPIMSKAGEYLARELPKIASTADSVRIATEFKRLIEQEEIEPDDENEGGQDSNGGQSESSKSSKGGEGEEGSDGEGGEGSEGGENSEGGESPDGEGGGSDESADGEGEGSEAGGEGEGEGDEESKSGADAKGEDKKSSKGKSRKSKETGRGSDPTVNESNGPDGKATADWRDIADQEKFDASLSKSLTMMSVREIKETDYPVWSRDFDFIGDVQIEDICHSWSDGMIKRLENAVDHMVGPMQKEIERIIAAQSRAHWSYGHRSGRLNASALSRMVAFNDERVFRRRHEGQTKDVAVSLVIDCSGSMGQNGKITVAAQTAYGLASVLDRVKVACEVIGFTTKGTLPNDAHREAAELGISWGRYDRLYMPVFKSFDKRFGTEEARKMAALSDAKFMSSNIDGECVEIAAERLLKRKEKRKIMIVLSDGQPAGHGRMDILCGHLRQVVRKISSAGIEVFGIGIDSHAVKDFYPKHVVITRVDELPTVVIGKMKEFLL